MKGAVAVSCLVVLISSCTGTRQAPAPVAAAGSTSSSVAPLPPVSAESELFLATKREPDVVGMQALFRGPLVVRDACVLIGSSGAYTFPLWPEGFTAARGASGQLQVRDRQGAIVAVEGETFEMSGGYIAEFRPRGNVDARYDELHSVEELLAEPIPERCLGRDVYGVWSVGQT